MNVSVVEYIFFAVVCFFPFMIFAYYPLRYFLRFEKRTTVILEIAMAVPEVILFLMAAKYLSQYYVIIVAVIILFNVFAYIFLYKVNMGRRMFNLLLLINVANYTIMAAKVAVVLLFPNIEVMDFSWQHTVGMIVAEAVCLLPSFIYIKYYSDRMIRGDDYDYLWKIAWLVPFLLSCIGFYTVYSTRIVEDSLLVLYAKKTIICAVFVACLLLIYSFLAKLINRQNDIVTLEKNLYHQELQQMQYRKIDNQIKETRTIRHDLRHHVNLMCNYVDIGAYDKLKEYLHQYSKSINNIAQLHYTDHSALNMILVYYADLCRAGNIDFVIDVFVSDKLPLEDYEVTVSVGNLLENAYQACMEMKEDRKRFIHIHAGARANFNTFVIENSFCNALKIDESSGRFLTTKVDGSGIGLPSVREVVAKYDGFIKVEPEDSVFTVSISIPNKKD